METRKVQRLGNSTLALTLPAEWTTERGIQKGDELTIRRTGEGSLTVLAPATSSPGTEVVVHADELDPAGIERAIIGQYVLGRGVIHVQRSDAPLSNSVIEAVNRAETQLMGLGVVEETPERISIRCSIDASDFTLPELVRRLENTSRRMRDEAVDALVRGDPDLARRAYDRERQANKIFLLLLRLIFSVYQDPHLEPVVGLDDSFPTIGYRSVTKNLELTADNAEDIAEIALEGDAAVLNLDKATIKEIRAITDEINEMTALAVEAVVEGDFALTQEVRSSFHEIGKRQTAVLDQLPEMSNAELLEVREVLVSLHESAQYAMRNAEIAANIALKQESDFVTR